jgi:hypothetical protein
MTRLATMARAFLLFAVVLAGLAGRNGPSVAAQSVDVEPDSYVSELADLEVAISGSEFEIYDAQVESYRNGEGEIVQLASTTSYVQIAFYDDTDTSQETLEIYNETFTGDVDDFEVLDEGTDGDSVYTYALATYNGVEFLYYLTVTENVVGNVDVLQRMYAPDKTFFEDIAAAQDDITIGDAGFLEDVDVADLESLAGDAGLATGDEPAEEPTASADEPVATEEDAGQPEDESPRGSTLDGEVYEMQLVHAELVYTDDVTLLDSLYEDPVMEQVQLQLGATGAFALVEVLQNPMDAEATLDMLLGNIGSGLDSVENLGSDASDTSAWSLDIGEVDGETTVIFIWVDGDRYNRFHYVELLLTTEATFLDDLDAFGRAAEVDGEGLFTAADRAEIESLLNGGSSTNEREGEDSGTSSDRRDRSKVGKDDETQETSERGTGQDEGPDGLDLESQGLVSESEFESLQHGVSVEWDDTVWAVDPAWELSAVSDSESGVDSVILFWADGGASMMIQIMPADGNAPSDFVDAWESDEYILDSVHEDAEVLLVDSGRNSGAVVYLTYDGEGEELILVQEVLDIDGGETVALVTMFGTAAELADAYADAEDLVAVDGIDLVSTFTPREIENAVTP